MTKYYVMKVIFGVEDPPPDDFDLLMEVEGAVCDALDEVKAEVVQVGMEEWVAKG